MVAATCLGVAEFNSGIELSMQKLFNAVDIGPYILKNIYK